MIDHRDEKIRFDDQVAIVTGAGNGLGACHARALAARGARVAIVDLGQDGVSAAAEEVAQEVNRAGGVAVAHCADVTDPGQMNALAQRILASWGRIDVLVNNAGALLPGSLTGSSLEHLQRAMDVNFWGSVHACRAVWDSMRGNGYGRIVVTTSSAGLFGSDGIAGYCAAKAALVGLMNALHAEGAGCGIRVNAIAPTAATNMNRSLLPPKILPLLDPGAVSPAVLYLVSRDAPSRAILSAGAGVFALDGILETPGEYLPPHLRSPEAIAERFATMSAFEAAAPVKSSYAQSIKMVTIAAQAEHVDLGAGDVQRPSADRR